MLANHTVTSIALSIDVAPTFTAIASGEVPDDMDGVSLLPLLGKQAAPSSWRTDFMVDYHGQGHEPCGMVKCPAPPANNWHLIDGFNNTYTVRRPFKHPPVALPEPVHAADRDWDFPT